MLSKLVTSAKPVFNFDFSESFSNDSSLFIKSMIPVRDVAMQLRPDFINERTHSLPVPPFAPNTTTVLSFATDKYGVAETADEGLKMPVLAVINEDCRNILRSTV